MARKKDTKVNRKDWRNLPYDDWNTLTVHAYFADMNAERYGVDYLPMRNWSFEQGIIKRALTQHGAELLHAAFNECFREYQPAPSYPILTAGFAISYRINAVIPKLLADRQRREDRNKTDNNEQTISIEEATNIF